MNKVLELYKFCENKEMRWSCNDLIAWLNFDEIQEFTNIIGYDYLCEGGIESNLQMDCIGFNLVPICEYFNIEPTDIYKKRRIGCNLNYITIFVMPRISH